MRNKTTLTITSLISTVCFACHWADEISRGLEPGTLNGAGGIAILVVWACGPLLLAERRAGYILMLVFGILGLGVTLLHMSGHGMVGGRIANTPGIFFWVLILVTLAVTSALTVILAGTGIWASRQASRG